MVFSCKWLLLLPSSVSVQGLVCVHYFIRLAICCVVALCLHSDSKCGQVSLALVRHSVLLRLAKYSGQKRLFWWLPTYWVDPNSSTSELCVYMGLGLWWLWLCCQWLVHLLDLSCVYMHV